MTINDALQLAACLFSVAAAILWIRSATITIPNPMENMTWAGTGHFPDALKAQSRWSAAAAGCAAIAALIQAAALAYPLLSNWTAGTLPHS
jgi:hypothetical protein